MIIENLNGFRIVPTLFFILLSFTALIHAQTDEANKISNELQSRILPQIRIKGEGIDKFFTNLSLTYNIPIGVEVADENMKMNTVELDFGGGGLGELLNEFVSRKPMYRWEIFNGIVYIYPNTRYRSAFLRNLLNTTTRRLIIRENMNCWSLVKELVDSPEIKDLMVSNKMGLQDINFSGSYFPSLGKQFSMSIEPNQLIYVLSALVRNSPTAKIWVLRSVPNTNRFSLQINASIDSSAPKNLDISQFLQ